MKDSGKSKARRSDFISFSFFVVALMVLLFFCEKNEPCAPKKTRNLSFVFG
jgi:hypothetical protein